MGLKNKPSPRSPPMLHVKRFRVRTTETQKRKDLNKSIPQQENITTVNDHMYLFVRSFLHLLSHSQGKVVSKYTHYTSHACLCMCVCVYPNAKKKKTRKLPNRL
jgi:hypothetical protein